MAKWYGNVGFVERVETTPGVWVPQVTERPYFGDEIRNVRMLQNSGEVNDNVKIGNQISIVSDPFAVQNFHSICCVEYMGAKWKVENATVQYPRILLTLGGVWNGKPTGFAE